MSSPFWEKAESLFLQASEMDAPARAAFLAELAAEDPALHDEVADMLRIDAEASRHNFLDEALFNWREENLEPAEGEHIGAYRIERKLGEGGMGAVYLAHQAEPIKREVALKLIKAGMDSRQVVARFRMEQHILAKLKHPYIAHVYDGGISEQGRPWFAMEYINGVPISTWCDQHGYAIHTRLELFLRLCDAVHYAHRRGCLHRDLKPANVLVCEQNGVAVPKVIDFGIAKATAGEANPNVTVITMAHQRGAHLTAVGGVLGSLGYMSPEQAALDEQDIDVRTDVYALGVILFELLVGCLPFPVRSDTASGWEHLLKRIREREAPRPSRFPNLDPAAIEDVAKARDTDRRQLAKVLARDLDWVVLKALAKNRERRYDSVRDLADDLRRYLGDEPVAACPPSVPYRLGKFVKRHRTAAGVAAFLCAGVLVGVVGLSWGLWRATNAEQQARLDADRALRMVNLMDDFLSSPDPEKRGKDLKVVDLLDSFSGHLSNKGEGPSLETALLHRTVAKTYYGLGVYDRALEHFQTSLDLLTEAGADTGEIMSGRYFLARTLRRLGRRKESLAILEAVVRWRVENLGPDREETLRAVGMQARLLGQLGRSQEATPLLEQVFAAYERQRGFNDDQTLIAANGLASAYMRNTQLEQAETLYQRILRARETLLGVDHPRTLETQVNLLILAHTRQRYAESDELSQRALEACQRVYGPQHPYTAAAKTLRAAFHTALGRYEQAEAMFRELLAENESRYGADHPNTLDIRNNFAGLYHRWGRFEQSAEMNRAVYQQRRDTLGENHAATLGSRSNLAFDLYKLKRLDDALSLAQAVLAARTEHLGADHLDTLMSHKILGEILLARGDADSALTHLTTAKTMLDDIQADSEDALDLQYHLAEAHHQLQQEQKCRAAASLALPIAKRRWSPQDPRFQKLNQWVRAKNER